MEPFAVRAVEVPGRDRGGRCLGRDGVHDTGAPLGTSDVRRERDAQRLHR